MVLFQFRFIGLVELVDCDTYFLKYKLEKRLRSVQKARRLVSFSIIKIFIIIMNILVIRVIQFLRVLSSVIQGEAHFQIYVSRNKGTVTQTCHNCLTSSAKKQDKSEYRKRNMREKPGLIQTGSPPDFSWEWVVGTLELPVRQFSSQLFDLGHLMIFQSAKFNIIVVFILFQFIGGCNLFGLTQQSCIKIH